MVEGNDGNHSAAETSRNSAAALLPSGDLTTPHHYSMPPERFQFRVVHHPRRVRQRAARVTKCYISEDHVGTPDRSLHLTTIGKTFLDMLNRPELCDGKSHFHEVCDEYVTRWCDKINASINAYSKKIVKCRARPVPPDTLQTHEVILYAIAGNPSLRESLYLNGGSLMTLVYDSPRRTTDMDCSYAPFGNPGRRYGR